RPEWNALTAWELVQRDGATATLEVKSEQPLHPNTPSYAVLDVTQSGGGAGLLNTGFDGIAVKSGERYDFSVFANRLGNSTGGLTVRLESKTGALLAEASLPAPSSGWKKYTASLEPNATVADARLVLLAKQPGRIGLDMISLFPAKTF